MRVKICGIRSATDAALCVRAGASALGFLCGVPPSVPCYISPSEAREIIGIVPPYVSTVLVTTLSQPQEIEELLRQVPASTLQFHGAISPDHVADLRVSKPYLKLIRTIQVISRDSVAEARLWESHVDALLLDSKGEGDLGGTGRTHDWNLSREIVQVVTIPVILAGGLKPDNVQRAVRATEPFGVDVNSGVTDPLLRKNPQKVAEFIKLAREAELEGKQ
ncbi:MAG: phosphoribosylanthranilate isomerase [Acidobacteria bacterium]|nr:phosphoribosylanthranilate isomerase [Acidobacteriota bacterium]